MKHEVDQLILGMLRLRPRSQAEITHASPLSQFGTIYRLMRLEGRQEIIADRSRRHHSTTYRLAPANENQEEKERTPGRASHKEDSSDGEIILR